MINDREEAKKSALYFLKKLSAGIKKDAIEIATVETSIETDALSVDGVRMSYIPTGFETITIRYFNKKEA